LRAFFENIGFRAAEKLKSLTDFFVFSQRALFSIICGDFLRRTEKEILVIQLYFTSFQLLFSFVVMSLLFGSFFIALVFMLVKNYGLVQYLGNIIMGVVVLELAPLITVILLALRSSSAINSEIAVMRVNREMDALEAFHIDPMRYLFIPRIVCFMISVTILSAVFAIVVLVSGFVICSMMFGFSGNIYTELLANSATPADFAVFFLKTALFGFFISVIPIYHGWKTPYQLTAIPVSVLRGMMGVFVSIVFVEVITSALRLLLNSL
jgi:phospholipid/cholesterol/gamma-HCH transport system permease protein